MILENVLVCIPAFNEESYIASVIVQTKNITDNIIVCDDGSNDLTSEIVNAMGVKVIKHETNQGYGAALKTLFQYALEQNDDIIVTIDSDRQHDPMQIPKLVNKINDGYDLVIGSRFLEDDHQTPRWRKAGIDVITALSSQGLDITDSQSGFRAYRKDALAKLRLKNTGMGISTEILLNASQTGLKVTESPITISYHKESSTENPIAHGFRVVASTVRNLSSHRPLLYFGFPGFLITLASLYLWLQNFVSYQTTGRLDLFNLLLSSSILIIGLLLVITGLILSVFVTFMEDYVIMSEK